MAKNQRNRSRNSHINSIIMQFLFVKREKKRPVRDSVRVVLVLVFSRSTTWYNLVRDGSFFYPNLAVEEVSNYKLLLGHSHVDYVEPLLNRTSSTAKLG